MRFAIFLTATAITFAPPALARNKDLRTLTSTSGVTEIGFCSRPSPNAFGFPGHTFVTFSASRPDGGRDFRSVGHTVAAGASVPATVFSYFGGSSVAGKQAEERYTSVKEACLVVQLNRAEYDKALEAAQPTLTVIGIPANVAASIERYSMGSDDCISFAIRVANSVKSAGLIVPPRSPADTPASWIGKLMTANT